MTVADPQASLPLTPHTETTLAINGTTGGRGVDGGGDVDEHKTLRLLMFEVWEEGQHFPLFITSDGTEARRELHEGDTLVKRWWVREGPLAAVGAHRDALADGSVDDPESRSLVPADQERNEQ